MPLTPILWSMGMWCCSSGCVLAMENLRWNNYTEVSHNRNHRFHCIRLAFFGHDVLFVSIRKTACRSLRSLSLNRASFMSLSLVHRSLSIFIFGPMIFEYLNLWTTSFIFLWYLWAHLLIFGIYTSLWIFETLLLCSSTSKQSFH
jgi:hypothetical protein